MDALKVIDECGVLSPVDRALAKLLRKHDVSKQADVVALTAALISYERSRGNSCVQMDSWAGRPFPTESGKTSARLPKSKEWADSLRKSKAVGDGSEPTPLVLTPFGRAYFYRDFRAEKRVAKSVRDRLARTPQDDGLEGLGGVFRKLFPEQMKNEVDWQALAAASALRHSFTIVTGGPGTGKTTTVARMLALLLAREPDLRIALAAPTGKAAARMGESLGAQINDLPVKAELRKRIPKKAGTLHRLLGYLPQEDQYRYSEARPLAVDVLVVDEASMVDLLLMDALFAATPPEARIILLGDKDQLASVETGYVLGDLCRAAELNGKVSAAFAEAYERLSGAKVPCDDDCRSLRDASVELRKSYRFMDHPGIGAAATAIREGKSDGLIKALRDDSFDEVSLAPYPRTADDVLKPVESMIKACCKAESVDAALEVLGRFRILSPTRGGKWGVENLIKAVEAMLHAAKVSVKDTWYQGRPVMVTANDYHVNLYNGDVGICWPDGDTMSAWFHDEKQKLRRVPLAKLPPHETAWAMTVHKSQGSEFDEVLLVLPDVDSPILTRELLYTGVTRARKRVHLFGAEERINAAVNRTAIRVSGLAEGMAIGS